jgi:hypothetical protein
MRLYAHRHHPFRVPGGPVPRVAPDTRPGKTRQSAFALVKAVQGNSLRSRVRARHVPDRAVSREHLRSLVEHAQW